LYGDRDGNTIVDGLTYEARLDTGAFANYAAITVVNAISAFVASA
jgi:hypothetical protein